jgi:hypothetical protein
MRLIALVAFDGCNPACNADAAAEALRAAGYEVHRMPAVHPKMIGHPLDDHIEAFIEGPPGPPYVGGIIPLNVEKVMDVVMCEVESLVDPFGGDCHGCGPVEDGYVPFTETFCGAPMQVPPESP